MGGDGGMQNCFDQEQTAQRALNKANTALYVIDARGSQSVQPDSSIGSSDLGCTYGCDALGTLLANERAMTQTALLQIEQSHAVMLEMAEKAGGAAYFTNDILGELQIPFNESRAMYALGFYPEDAKLDGSYHALEVKLPGRPDLTVRYRRGYVDESSDPKEQLRTALWSPLDSSGIALSAQLVGNEIKVNIGVAGLSWSNRTGGGKGGFTWW